VQILVVYLGRSVLWVRVRVDFGDECSSAGQGCRLIASVNTPCVFPSGYSRLDLMVRPTNASVVVKRHYAPPVILRERIAEEDSSRYTLSDEAAGTGK
jgi:hypothetical protein